MLMISGQASVSRLADIEESVKGSNIVIGDGTVIDSFVKIKPAGGTADVVIGQNCRVNSGTVMYSGNGIQIGNNVLIAANCTLAPVNHEYRRRDLTIAEQHFQPSKGGILIEDDVWIGAGTVILDGARLRKGCVIGAQSLVVGEVEAYSMQAGSPLRLIKYRTEGEGL